MKWSEWKNRIIMILNVKPMKEEKYWYNDEE